MKLFQIEERKIKEIIIKDRTRTEIGDIDNLAENNLHGWSIKSNSYRFRQSSNRWFSPNSSI